MLMSPYSDLLTVFLRLDCVQINLPDDRVIIVSGFLDDPARQSGKPAPSIDVFDYKSRT